MMDSAKPSKFLRCFITVLNLDVLTVLFIGVAINFWERDPVLYIW